MADVDAVFRPEFRDALVLLAKAIGNMRERGFGLPILVGGAAVEFYTGGAVTTGDFDFVTPLQEEFFEELERVGFRKPARTQSPRMRVHSSGLAVEVVSGPLMDGRADMARIVEVELSGGAVRMIPVEELIADRAAQALAGRGIDPRMKSQAVQLLVLGGSIDRAYLDRRIGEETGGDADLATVENWAREEDFTRNT
jgi:hypothetical protein